MSNSYVQMLVGFLRSFVQNDLSIIQSILDTIYHHSNSILDEVDKVNVFPSEFKPKSSVRPRPTFLELVERTKQKVFFPVWRQKHFAESFSSRAMNDNRECQTQLYNFRRNALIYEISDRTKKKCKLHEGPLIYSVLGLRLRRRYLWIYNELIRGAGQFLSSFLVYIDVPNIMRAMEKSSNKFGLRIITTVIQRLRFTTLICVINKNTEFANYIIYDLTQAIS